MSPSTRPFAWILIAGAWIYVGSVLAGGPSAAAPKAANEASPPPPPARGGAAAGAATITMTFWNVEWFPGHKPNPSPGARAPHLAAVVPVLEKLNPDLLGLEEVADLPAAQSIAERLKGFKVDICSQFALPDSPEIGKQQVVLCSRLPVLQAWAEPWKTGAKGVLPRRGFAVAVYQSAPGQILIAYALHLKSNRVDTPGGAADNFAMRQESARQLLAHAKTLAAAYSSMGKVSTVLGGDLNTSLDDPQFAAETTLPDLQKAGFQWVWKDVPFAQRQTLMGGGPYPPTCFDHIFLWSEGAQFAAPSVENTSRDCSDHRPVTVQLRF